MSTDTSQDAQQSLAELISLDGRTAVVTGAGQGIGEAFCVSELAAFVSGSTIYVDGGGMTV